MANFMLLWWSQEMLKSLANWYVWVCPWWHSWRGPTLGSVDHGKQMVCPTWVGTTQLAEIPCTAKGVMKNRFILPAWPRMYPFPVTWIQHSRLMGPHIWTKFLHWIFWLFKLQVIFCGTCWANHMNQSVCVCVCDIQILPEYYSISL